MSQQPPPPSAQPPPPEWQPPAKTSKPWWRRWWVIGIGVIVLFAAIGAALEEPEDETEVAATATPEDSPTPETTEPEPEPTPTTEEPEPEPTSETPTVSAEDRLAAFKIAFETTTLDTIRTELGPAIESDMYWIDSIDRVSYDPDANVLLFEGTVDYENVYNRDPAEWRDDTWELFRSLGRDVWAPYMEGFESGAGNWDTWTPQFHFVANTGRLHVKCPGTIIVGIAEVDATQADYESQCDIIP